MEIFYNRNTHTISRMTCDLKLIIIIFTYVNDDIIWYSAVLLDGLTANVYDKYYTKWTK